MNFRNLNSSLIKDLKYASETRDLISSFLSNDIFSMNAQWNWELLKYEIHKFTIDYTIHQAKEKRKEQAYLESKLKKRENKFGSSNNLRKYESLKNG